MSDTTWIKHPSGILYCRGTRKGELLYQIKGADEWLSEKAFDRRCQAIPRSLSRVSSSAEAAGHQGPLRGPGPLDNRLFPPEGDPRENESRDRNYEIRSRDGRLPPEDSTSGRRGSTDEIGNGTTSILVSRTRGVDAGVGSQSTSRAVESADLSKRSTPGQSFQLSPLARNLVSLGLGNYLESSRFIWDNPTILAKSEIDALIAEASAAEKAGQSIRAQICIHQALLLRKCSEVGSNNIDSFFRDLAAKDGRTKDAFVNDVKKVYNSIQQQAARAALQNQGRTAEPQGRKAPVVLHTIERTLSQNSYTDSQEIEETTQSQTPVARGRDGKLYYTDGQGNLLHPASGRHDPERHRSQSDPIEPGGKMAAASREETSQSGANAVSSRADNRHAPVRAGSFHHTATPGPPEPLPTLHENHRLEYTRIGGTEGSVEKLDRRECLPVYHAKCHCAEDPKTRAGYRIRQDAKKFFECGRVFALLWHESAGGGGGAGGNRVHTELSAPVAVGGRFGEEVYSHIRRMVVVKEDHGFCLCLPINTYNGKGVTKHGLSDDNRRAHSIVYMTDTRPSCLPGEKAFLVKKDIAVQKASDDQKLDPMSRLNFGKIYTVEHNVKVMSVGRVTRESLPVLRGYWRNSLD